MNKNKINLKQRKLLKDCFDYFNNKQHDIIVCAVSCKFGECLEVENPVYRFVLEMDDFELKEIVAVIQGDYEVEISKEEKVEMSFKDNYDKIQKNITASEKWRCIGFNQGISFMNCLYDLNIDLEEK